MKPNSKNIKIARPDRFAGMFAPAVVDVFAGMGGWSIGAEEAIAEAGYRDRYIDLMINHWDTAVGVHQANHPLTEHLKASVLEVDPNDVLPGRKIVYAHFSPDCFPADTLILTEHGLTPIEAVEVGTRVLTHQNRWKPVTAVMQSVKDTIRLNGQGHPALEVSSEHPFYSRNCRFGWENGASRRIWNAPHWAAADQMQGKYWASPNAIPNIAEIPTWGRRPLVMSENFWWMVGRYLADGWTRMRDGIGSELVLAVGKHKAAHALAMVDVCPPSGDRAGDYELRWNSRQTKTSTHLITYHDDLIIWLREHFGHLAQNKRLPIWVLSMSEPNRRALLTGYMAGDGWNGGNLHRCSTVSKELAIGIRLLVQSLGWQASLHFGNSNDSQIDGRTIKCNFQPWVVSWRDPLRRRQAESIDHLSWSKVRDIAPGNQSMPCFNLSVEDDESYVADGIVVHNCTHHSRAKGGQPRKKEIRALADVVIVWAGKRRPDVITLENVPEFKMWGPLLATGKPDQHRRGEEFERWKSELEALGYVVEHRELRACDYGAPTTRNRLYVIARCDGLPIVWPEKTHGAVNSAGQQRLHIGKILRRHEAPSILRTHRDETRADNILPRRPKSLDSVVEGRTGHRSRKNSPEGNGQRRLSPYRTAAECIDWNEPMLSIFATKAEARAWAAAMNIGREKHERLGVPQRPLKPKTQKRLAGGLWKWVLNHAEPFIVNLQNWGWDKNGTRSVSDPLPTVTANPKGGAFAAADVELEPFITRVAHGDDSNGGARWGNPTHSMQEPLPTVAANKDFGVGCAETAAFASTLNHGGREDRSADVRAPLATVCGANDARAVIGTKLSTILFPPMGRNPQDSIVTTDESTGHTTNPVAPDVEALDFIPFTAGVGGRAGQSAPTSADAPLPTITGKADRVVAAVEIAGFSIPRYGERDGQAARSGSVEQPMPTVTGTSNGAQPVAVCLNKHYTGVIGQDVREPIGTVTGVDHHSLLAVHLTNYQGAKRDEVRAVGASDPIPTLDTQNRFGLVAAHVVKFRGDSLGDDLNAPLPTVTSGAGAARDAGAAHAMGVSAAGISEAAYLSHFYGSNTNGGGGDPREPAKTVTGGGQHANVSAVYLSAFYGASKIGHSAEDSLPTVTGNDRFALAGADVVELALVGHWLLTPATLRRAKQVARWAKRHLGKKVEKHLLRVTDEAGKIFNLLTTTVNGSLRLVTDVLMRMLRPRELARAQGFNDSYVIDRMADGRRVSKAGQVKLIGNSVCPDVARAIVRENVVKMGLLNERKMEVVA